MKPQATVAIPPRMAHLPHDLRGYPIPAMVHRDESGRPHFTISDEHRRQRIIREDRCSICDARLLRGRWFIGGAMSAFDPQGAYIDPPMHAECARYALQVCPYIAVSSYHTRIEAATLTPEQRRKALIVQDPTVEDERPEVFVAVMATDQVCIAGELIAGIEFVRFIKPRKPYRRVEYWRHGVQIDEVSARKMIEGVL